MKDLSNKIALVTGGTRGIGRATCLALADAGADVAFSYQHSKDQAEEVVRLLLERGVRARGIQADAGRDEDVQRLAGEVREALGPVSILVNNAGITRDKSLLKMTREMWDEVMRVNLDALFLVTQAILPGMLEAGWGRIIMVASIVGQTGNFGQTNYAATKGGAIAFAMSLAREVARKGVTVNSVAPGFIATDMTRNVPAPALEQIKGMTPMGRLGAPEEVADAVVFLASDRARYITGQVLAVNGGLYM